MGCGGVVWIVQLWTVMGCGNILIMASKIIFDEDISCIFGEFICNSCVFVNQCMFYLC